MILLAPPRARTLPVAAILTVLSLAGCGHPSGPADSTERTALSFAALRATDQAAVPALAGTLGLPGAAVLLSERPTAAVSLMSSCAPRTWTADELLGVRRYSWTEPVAVVAPPGVELFPSAAATPAVVTTPAPALPPLRTAHVMAIPLVLAQVIAPTAAAAQQLGTASVSALVSCTQFAASLAGSPVIAHMTTYSPLPLVGAASSGPLAPTSPAGVIGAPRGYLALRVVPAGTAFVEAVALAPTEQAARRAAEGAAARLAEAAVAGQEIVAPTS